MYLAILSVTVMHAAELPVGSAPEPVKSPHFPDRLHAFVWRNWQLVPPERMAHVVGASPMEIRAVGRSMGLSDPPAITSDQWRRSYITIIRRNWHLLPYEQLLELLDWSAEELAFCLREDDFLFVKLGLLKPRCAPLRYAPPGEEARAAAARIASVVQKHFHEPPGQPDQPLFHFVSELSELPAEGLPGPAPSAFSPRYCYSYFALYGDPLLDTTVDSYPDGYLARLAASGSGGVWLQGVLYKLAPFPWDESLSEGYETRLENLRALVKRAANHGLEVYLYLNEPRAMPLSFFEERPDLKGVTEGNHAALCTSVPAVQTYLRNAVAGVCRAVPDLAGVFTITASENFTSCWSHHRGGDCPRCAARGTEEVIAEVNALIAGGIAEAGTAARMIAWDWGWPDDAAEGIIARLPEGAYLMSVSEWSVPITRGGVESVVGEYSISTIGPGPRATRHWGWARERGLRTIAKIQANNTWELSAAPYIPAIENVARQAVNLREVGVDGLMLSWTLGGYPSPNLEVVAEVGRSTRVTADVAMESVALRRFGPTLAPAVVQAWYRFSEAFREFPFHVGSIYRTPMQMGPANPLWETPTGYASTMVGFPYDDLGNWRAAYPPDVFISQLEKIADGFDDAFASLEEAGGKAEAEAANRLALERELDVARACALHCRSAANQARFVAARDALLSAADARAAAPLIATIEATLEAETELARQMHAIQSRDSRIGFEASNHYFYVPLDLVEKVVVCEDLLSRWLPAERARHGL